MASYDPTVFQQDKTFIKDTVARFVRHHDNEVFAREVHVDFSDFLGGAPEIFMREEWVDRLQRMMSGSHDSQRATSGIFVNLQQPGPESQRPLTCGAIVMADGEVVEDGERIRIEGLFDLGLIRMSELERAGENPWRIYRQVARKA
ncbi:uncharacterized protein DNG_07041 [Cephalotrichum gorgonifer]|uniref:SnoaL-like domain-containing protein n=1 Tax=Cephalotrichum gorgonifer TaxID=2041049 RepID=A0AAE8N0T2_9PEZI|nr:uncharacterized protein DNG_07041 [Cephalotrichum gorgonifer]